MKNEQFASPFPEAETATPVGRGVIGKWLYQSKWAIALELALFFIWSFYFLPFTLLTDILHAPPFVNIGNTFLFPLYTPLALIFPLLSLWLRGMGLRDIGLKRPDHWGRVILLGVVCGLLWPFLSSIIDALITALISPVVHIGNQNLSLFSNLKNHNVLGLLSWIVVSFTFAAFGEEIIFRGYMVSRLADLFGTARMGLVLSVLVASLAFAFAHGYQGWAGLLSSFITGLAFGFLYVRMRRNLWANVLFHGINDTIGFIIIFFLIFK